MRTREGSRRSARLAPFFRSTATICLVVACLVVGLSATVALAVPAAPVVTGPSAIRFAYHPAGFRAAFNWDPVPTAVEYHVYNADTLVHLGSVPGTSCVVYGLQGTQYHYYIVAVDSTSATSTPSNIVNIKTSAPPAPAAPVGFELVPFTVFGVQTTSAPAGALPIEIPYDPFTVEGDAADLRLLRYDADSWTDVTTSVDTTRNVVLGLSAPSPVFAVMEPNAPVEPLVLTTHTTLLGPRTVRARRTARLAGWVLPLEAPGSVTITKQYRVGGSWVQLGSTTVPVNHGRYRYDFVPAKYGTWRLVATYSGGTVGSTSYLPSTSIAKIITVR